MPPGVDNSYATTRHQSCTRPEHEPLVRLFKSVKVTRQQILLIMRVINQKQVSTPACQSASNTGSIELTTFIGTPASC